MEQIIALRMAFNEQLIREMQGKFASDGMATIANWIFVVCFALGLMNEFKNIGKKSFLKGIISFFMRAWLVLALMYGGKYVGQISLFSRLVDGSKAPLYISLYNKVEEIAQSLEQGITKGATEQELAYNTDQLMKFNDNLTQAQVNCEMDDPRCFEAWLKTGQPPEVAKIENTETGKDPSFLEKLKAKVSQVGEEIIKDQPVYIIYKALVKVKRYAVAFTSSPGLFLLPFIQWFLALVAAGLNFGLLIFWGIAIAFSVLATQVLTPFFMLNSFKGQVKGMYKTFFSTALYGFVLKLIIWISNVIMGSMITVINKIMIPKIIAYVSSDTMGVFGSGRAILTIFMMSTFLTSFATIAIQVTAMAKVPQISRQIMFLSLESLVNIGETLFTGGLAFAQGVTVTAVSAIGKLATGAATGGGSLAAGGMASMGGKMAASKMGGAGIGGAGLGKSAGNAVEKGVSGAGSAAGKGISMAGSAAGKGISGVSQAAGTAIRSAGTALMAVPLVGQVLGAAAQIGGTAISVGGQMAGKAVEVAGKTAGKGVEVAGKVAGKATGAATKVATETSQKAVKKTGSVLKNHFSSDGDDSNDEGEDSNAMSKAMSSGVKSKGKGKSGKKEGFLSRNLKPGKIVGTLANAATTLTNSAFENTKAGAGSGSGDTSFLTEGFDAVGDMFNNKDQSKNENNDLNNESDDKNMSEVESNIELSDVDRLNKTSSIQQEKNRMNETQLNEYNTLKDSINQGNNEQDELIKFMQMNNKFETSKEDQSEYQNMIKNNKDLKNVVSSNNLNSSELINSANEEFSKGSLSDKTLNTLQEQINKGNLDKNEIKNSQMAKQVEEYHKKQIQQVEQQIKNLYGQAKNQEKISNKDKQSIIKLNKDKSSKQNLTKETNDMLEKLLKEIGEKK